MFRKDFRTYPSGFPGVKAASDIPNGTIVGQCPTEVCINLTATDSFTGIDQEIQVEYYRGIVKTVSTSLHVSQMGNNWLVFVQAARDSHEQNLELVQNNTYTYVKVSRDIRRGERLLVWFGTELCQSLNIPVLTPECIQGNVGYICTRCQQMFAFPNPLKSHLRICSNGPRLHGGLVLAGARCMPMITPLMYQRYVEAVLQQYAMLYNTQTHINKPTGLMPVGVVRPQPEKPGTVILDNLMTSSWLYKYRAQNLFPNFTDKIEDKFVDTHLNVLPLRTDKKKETQEMSPKVDTNLNYFNSSVNKMTIHNPKYKVTFPRVIDGYQVPPPNELVGEPLDVLPRSVYTCRSQRGHICVYCGKLYSRKYGLKIHLRTHTGYKPLKCKVCLRPFGDPSNLNKHIRLHAQGDTPYSCPHCGKILVRRRDLERHIKSRHPTNAKTRNDSQEITITNQEDCKNLIPDSSC